MSSEVVKKTKKKKTKIQYTEEVPAPMGPSSANPGAWLTNTWQNVMGAQHTTEPYEVASAILESYRPGLRRRVTRYPIVQSGTAGDLPAVEFLSDDVDAEPKSLCYGVADVRTLRMPPSGPRFPMIRQPNVLSGLDLREHISHVREKFPDFYKEKPKKTKGKKKVSKPILRPVPMVVVESRYHTWFADPTKANEEVFAQDLYDMLRCRIFADKTSDGKKLWEHQRYEEYLNAFLLYFIPFLREKRIADEEIGKFGNYLNRAWNTRRRKASIERAEYEHYETRSTFAEEDEYDDYAEVFSPADNHDKASHYVFDNSFVFDAKTEMETLQAALTADEIRQRRIAALPSIADSEVRVMAAYRLMGKKDKEIAELMGTNRQKLGRIKNRANAGVNGAAE